MPCKEEEDEVNIFEDDEDCWQLINTLDRMRVRYEDDGNICETNCNYYAYCLMSNHFHLLIQEKDERGWQGGRGTGQ